MQILYSMLASNLTQNEKSVSWPIRPYRLGLTDLAFHCPPARSVCCTALSPSLQVKHPKFFHFRAFAFTLPSVWNILPRHLYGPPPPPTSFRFLLKCQLIREASLPCPSCIKQHTPDCHRPHLPHSPTLIYIPLQCTYLSPPGGKPHKGKYVCLLHFLLNL